ncbi:MAG: right-handed parallel beta-helix repeat-containing protein [Thermodesulfobacteriota bacterium]|nr:right-handed parallel beta-helix repeat-containing protein [Thermodesulfobacteriota bacterium]
MFPLPFIRLSLLVPFLGILSASTANADNVVNTVAELVSAVNNTSSGGDRTILIADGTYLLDGVYLRLAVNDITVRSLSGDREAVFLDGEYRTTEIFQVVASGAVIADLTLKRAYDHPVHVMAASTDVENTLISNVHIIDPGQQAIKINPNAGRTHFVNNGRITGCLIELTDSGRAMVWERNGSCYTGGVDAHQAEGWIVEDNEIRGFWCSGGLSEHGIHFWSDSSNTLVQRNLIVDCDRGIGFGLGSSGHRRGIIRNNMIYHGEDHGVSDVGIGLESTSDAQVYNNTVFHEHDYPNGIEYRFAASSNLTIVNNLTNRAITSRNGGTSSLISNNITNAAADWFIDAPNGDLHLGSEQSGVTDAALALSGLVDDFDGQSRPSGSGPDIGADEYPQQIGPALSWLLLLL